MTFKWRSDHHIGPHRRTPRASCDDPERHSVLPQGSTTKKGQQSWQGLTPHTCTYGGPPRARAGPNGVWRLVNGALWRGNTPRGSR